MSTKNPQTLVFHNGTTSQPLQVGKTHKFKAKAGERYRVVKRDGDAEQLLDNVVVKRRGEDLLVSYHEGTEVTLENYYVECKALASCDITLPGANGTLYRPGLETVAGAPLADDSFMVYAHGTPDALMAMTQGNDAMRSALTGSVGEQITYIPSHAFPLTNYAIAAVPLLAVLGSDKAPAGGRLCVARATPCRRPAGVGLVQ